MVNVVTEASSVGVPSYSETLPRLPESVRPAQRLVSSALHTWHLEDGEADAWHVVAELMANAVLHAQMSSVRVTVSRTDERTVRVAVIDRSHVLPTARQAAPDDEHGRGLAIVAALSADWGVTPLRWGKRVWADVRCGR